MIYADFENILVPEDKEANPDEFHTTKYQKYVACSYGYKLVCVNDNFGKIFKLYLGKDAVYNFINIMLSESKCWSDVTKKINKELVMTEKIMKILRTPLNVRFVKKIMLMVMFK